MRISTPIVALSLFAIPAAASAKPVLSPGELSVGAELFPTQLISVGQTPSPNFDRGVTPATGFNVRYAFDQMVALYGTIGFSYTTVSDDADDSPVLYALGVGGQLDFAESERATFLFKGGVQFLPRFDDDGDQELGVRIHAGPGVEARVTDALSLQFATGLFNLQFGGETRFDLELMPSVAAFIYF